MKETVAAMLTKGLIDYTDLNPAAIYNPKEVIIIIVCYHFFMFFCFSFLHGYFYIIIIYCSCRWNVMKA